MTPKTRALDVRLLALQNPRHAGSWPGALSIGRAVCLASARESKEPEMSRNHVMGLWPFRKDGRRTFDVWRVPRILSWSYLILRGSPHRVLS